MRKFEIVITVLALSASMTRAEHPKPPVPEGMMVLNKYLCYAPNTPVPTSEQGDCETAGDLAGNFYTIFRQNGLAIIIWQIYNDGRPHKELWVADRYNTF